MPSMTRVLLVLLYGLEKEYIKLLWVGHLLGSVRDEINVPQL